MEKEKTLPSQLIQNFAPGWFALIMGTGVLAMLTLMLSRQCEWLTPLAWGLHWLNIIAFVVLSIPWLLRWVLYRSNAIGTLKHPVQASFYPTYSIGLLILSAQCLLFGMPVVLAETLWWAGALMTYAFSLAVLYNIFNNEAILPEHITPAYYIPAVGLVVIPVAGISLLAHMSGIRQDLALLLNTLGFGAGAVMYVGLLGLTFFRLYLHKPAFGMLTPTIWIQAAPLGIIPVSMMNLFSAYALPGAIDGAKAVGVLFWAAGIWWVLMAAMMTLTAWKKKQFPFALSWWGFIFPLGALATLSLRLSHELNMSMFYHAGVMVWLLMMLLWMLTFVKTVQGVVKGTIFKPHP
ncbi:MAG: hypothetical protein ACRCWR_08165 [Saezia sp.]